MNKQVLVTLVTSVLAAAPLVSAAAPEVYGRAIAFLESCSTCDNTDETWNLQPGGSRLGVKGSEDLGEGLKAIYTFEFGIDTDGGSTFDIGDRPKWVGLAGDWGQIKAGRQFHPQWDYVAGPTDIFSEGMIRNQLGNRANDMVYYNSPKLGVFDFGLAGTFGGGIDEEDVDESQLGARVTVGPVQVGAVAASVRNADFGDRMGVRVTYKGGPVHVVAAFESVEVSEDTDRQASILIGEFTFGNNVFLAGYGIQEEDDVDAEPSTAKAEYRRMLSKATRFWIAGISNDSDSELIDDEVQWQLGLRVDF